jgi:hypothetical protein
MLDNKCDLQVDLEEAILESSDTLRGTVSVEVADEVHCDGLVLERRFETDGSGDTDEGGFAHDTLCEGTWKPGETYEYTFEMELPPGPYSYNGEEFDLQWRVEARADIPWALDPSETAEFHLEPGGEPDYEAVELATDEAVDEDVPVQTGQGFMRFAGGAMIAVGLFMLGAAVLGAQPDEYFLMGFFGVLGLLFTAGGYQMFSLGTRNRRAQGVVGEVEFDVSPPQVTPGDAIYCEIRLNPPNPVELQGVDFTLVNRERSTESNPNSNSSTFHQTRLDSYETTLPESKGATLEAGREATFETTFELPSYAEYSVDTGKNEVQWAAGGCVRLPDASNWSGTLSVVVRPDADRNGG